MASRRAKNKELKIHLRVVDYHGQKLFFDRASGRATAILRSSDLPYGSTLVLWRSHYKVGSGEVTLEGYGGNSGDYFETFCSKSDQLVEPDAKLMRHPLLRVKEGYYANEIHATSMEKGDHLILVVRRASIVPSSKENWTMEQWFERATQRSRRAAYEAVASTAAWLIIDRLLEDAFPKSEDWMNHALPFRRAKYEAPWRKVLLSAIKKTKLEERLAQPRQPSAKAKPASKKRK